MQTNGQNKASPNFPGICPRTVTRATPVLRIGCHILRPPPWRLRDTPLADHVQGILWCKPAERLYAYAPVLTQKACFSSSTVWTRCNAANRIVLFSNRSDNGKLWFEYTSLRDIFTLTYMYAVCYISLEFLCSKKRTAPYAGCCRWFGNFAYVSQCFAHIAKTTKRRNIRFYSFVQTYLENKPM